MAHPNEPMYRNVLEVSPTWIAGLDEITLNELMRNLLVAQAYLSGASVQNVNVNTEVKAKDKGCDGWTSAPTHDCKWLGTTETCWQFKAKTAGQPSKLVGEIENDIPHRTLRNGGRYVLVASGSTSGQDGRIERRNILIDGVRKLELPADAHERIDVFDSESLAAWCNEMPAVAARWTGHPHGVLTLGNWEKAGGHGGEWQVSNQVMTEVQQLRADLDFETGTIWHLHLRGRSGVGMTRFALELCRGDPLEEFVVYVDGSDETLALKLVNDAVNQPHVRLILVADETELRYLEPLRNALELGEGRVRLITIGQCPTPNKGRIYSHEVQSPGLNTMMNIVGAWYPGISNERAEYVARFADGNVQLARLTVQAADQNPQLGIQDLLKCEDIKSKIKGILGDTNLPPLHVVAVLSRVGWTDDVMNEGQAVASHLDLDWNSVRNEVGTTHEKLDIIPSSGRYRRIAPAHLGLFLAADAWTKYPDLLRTLPDVLPTEQAKEAYYKRLRSIAGNPEVRQFAADELDRLAQDVDYRKIQDVRLWAALSFAEPNTAATMFNSALADMDMEDRREIDGQAKLTALGTLQSLAWRSGSFPSAIRALASLSESEFGTRQTQATNKFIGLFKIGLGGTATPFIERLEIIDEFLQEDSIPKRRLAVKALRQACVPEAMRWGIGPATDEIPEPEWTPNTPDEAQACFIEAIRRLIVATSIGVPELEQDLVANPRELAQLLTIGGGIREVAAELFGALRNVYPSSREPIRREIFDVLDRARNGINPFSKDVTAEIDAVHNVFVETSLLAQLQQSVGHPRWDRVEEPDYGQLARDFMESGEAKQAEAWGWLTSNDAQDSFLFGRALAQVEPKGSPIPELIDGIEGTDRTYGVACGYVSAKLEHVGLEWFEQWIEQQANRRPRPLLLIFATARYCGATARVARCIEEIFRTESEPIPSHIVAHLGFGLWSEPLEFEVLESLVGALLDAGQFETALTLVELRLKSRHEESSMWREKALRLVCEPATVKSNDPMVGHRWSTLALRLAETSPGDIVDAIFEAHGDRTGKYWSIQFSDSVKVLDACITYDPDAVWAALAPRIGSKSDALLFSTGFPRNILERLPHEKIMGWIADSPEERAAVMSRYVGSTFASDDSLETKIIAQYSTREDVSRAFFCEFHSGIWSGPTSNEWITRAHGFRDASERSKIPAVKSWCMAMARDLERSADSERQREEEEAHYP